MEQKPPAKTRTFLNARKASRYIFSLPPSLDKPLQRKNFFYKPPCSRFKPLFVDRQSVIP